MSNRKKYPSSRARSKKRVRISYGQSTINGKSLIHKQSILLLCFLGLLSGMGVWALTHDTGFTIFKDPEVQGRSVDVVPEKKFVGAFTGIKCLGATTRPFGVMVAGDHQARPLSGIQSADMVIEMPVIVGSITRYLAFFQCGQPPEVGSIRSARGPFIGLAKGYNAIYGHWGGEHDVLSRLRGGIINNVDALVNPFDAYFRKRQIPMPHNGFTSYQRFMQASAQLAYSTFFEAEPFFLFKEARPCADCPAQRIVIGYPGIFRVSYDYNLKTGRYTRFKGGSLEIDKLTQAPVEVNNVIVMRARMYPTYSQYADAKIDGKEGALQAFIGGKVIEGTWKKSNFDAPLLFFDTKGNPLLFSPGNIWVQVLGLDQSVEINPYY